MNHDEMIVKVAEALVWDDGPMWRENLARIAVEALELPEGCWCIEDGQLWCRT